MKDKNKGHFNYSYRLEDKNNPESVVKGWWVETTKEEAYVNFWKSMVCGDVGDNVKGIEGSGEAAFNKLLAMNQVEIRTLEEAIYQAYKKRYGEAQGIYEFQKNYRLLHMLDCEADFIREVGELPMFPTITALNIQQEEIPNF